MNYRAFLNEHNGNPNKKNNSNETALHAVCSLSPQSPYSAQERRAACVTILLNWQGVELSDGRREKIRLSVQNNVIQPKINIIISKSIKIDHNFNRMETLHYIWLRLQVYSTVLI